MDPFELVPVLLLFELFVLLLLFEFVLVFTLGCS